jgi:hypothetical protein
MTQPEPNQPNPSSNADSCEYIHRTEPRIESEHIACSSGQVADITGSGMRLIFPKGQLPQVGEVQSYTFSDGTDSIEVTGCVKWVRKGSAFSRQAQAGVEFVKLNPDTRESLIRLAVRGKLKEPRSRFVQIEQTDLYRILGVTRYASAEQIDEAFNASCNRWNGEDADDPSATQKLDEVYKAYAVLSDPDKRAQYDTRFADQHDRAA